MIIKNTIGTKGFTLIEIIVTLLIVGIISAVAGLWIVRTVDGFVFARQNAETLQKGQMALTRLIREFNMMGAVSSSTAASVSFTSYRGGNQTNSTIALAGSAVTLDGDVLVDSVSGFEMGYYDTYNGTKNTTWTSGSSSLIDIKLTLNGAGGTPMDFTARVSPRNQ